MFNWLMYSGCNITFKLNPFHWRISFNYNKTNAQTIIDIESWKWLFIKSGYSGDYEFIYF